MEIVNKLDEFMHLKKKRIKEIFSERGLESPSLELYWTSEDKKLLELVPLPNLVMAKSKLICNFRFFKEGSIVGYRACPFCLAFENRCSLCPYGKEKGDCNEEGSVYHRAIVLPMAKLRIKDEAKLREELAVAKHEDLIKNLCKGGFKDEQS